MCEYIALLSTFVQTSGADEWDGFWWWEPEKYIQEMAEYDVEDIEKWDWWEEGDMWGG